MDEARFGLLPTFRRMWSRRGVRPVKHVQLKYNWVYLFSVVEPYTGKTFSMLWDSVSLVVMQHFLDEYSKTLAEDEICLLILDGAGWHSEKGLKFPENVIPLKQPAYSPECNPTESLWNWVRDKLGIKLYKNINEMKTRLIEIVNQFGTFREELSSRLNFKWWNEAVI
jgi:hypothetical protein